MRKQYNNVIIVYEVLPSNVNQYLINDLYNNHVNDTVYSHDSKLICAKLTRYHEI